MPIFNPVIHQTSTLIVAASDSLYAERVDFTCDGTADDVEINAAFALGAADTRVVLLEGTYTLADPIIFTHNNQVLEGQGRGTLIDGDGLATTEHAIQIDALTNCTVRNLAVQTAEGGALTIHCIFINDGANYTTIEKVTIIDGESDGIHIEGTNTTDIKIIDCVVEDIDDHGIFVDMDAAAQTTSGIQITGCRIIGAGDDGVFFGATGGGHTYARIVDNLISGCGDCGIDVCEMTYSLISDNIVHTNTDDGISLSADSNYNTVVGNNSYNNTDDGIDLAGNYNQITANLLNGNGTSIADTGTGNRIKNNEGHVEGDEGTATLVVAASTSMSPANADYTCDNTADEVQINAALAALPAAGGKVVLLEGTFTLADPITIPANNITLEGQGEATFIDGDGLATGEHAILVPARTSCVICKLRIQTEDGGTKVCHCIYATGLCSGLEIYEVTITDSDSDGIHIAPEDAYDIHIHNCTIGDADGYGIIIDPPAGDESFRLHVKDCLIVGTGNSGIYLGDTGDGHVYAEVNNNLVYGAGAVGIFAYETTYSDFSNNIISHSTEDGILLNTCSYCSLEGNISEANVQHGIHLVDADGCNVSGNTCTGNDSGNTGTYDGINLAGTSTQDNIVNNHCCSNHRYGIYTAGLETNISGNFTHENDWEGIYVHDSECNITGNYVSDNGQDGAGTYHGIVLSANADNCKVEGNYLYSGGAHDMQEDGIYLVSGAVHCSIVGNYCYYLLGDGIHLAGANTGTLIKSNICYRCAENGIVVIDSADCSISDNHCMDNTHHGIYLDNVDEATVNDNYCQGNDRLNSATYDGIYVDVDSSYVNIVGNHCTENDRYGIYVLSTTCELTANHALDNTTGQISVAAGTTMAHNETGATPEVHEPREATITVAASDSLTASADYVCDGTADDVQIQAALTAADGGRVILLEGSYILAANLTIPASTTLEGQGFGTILNFGGASITNALTINGSNSCLKNLKAVISAGAGGGGSRPNIVRAMQYSKIIIEHLWLVGDKTVASDGSLGRQNGIYIRTTNSKIFNCIVENNHFMGIHIYTGTRNDISGNLCKDSKNGINLRSASVGNVIVHNICESNDRHGIECFALTKMNTITANRCYDNYHGIYLANSSKQVVSSNICTDSDAVGIYLDPTSTENQVSANQCSDNAAYGIYIYASRNSIVGNICVDNASCGIYLMRVSYCVITGNACYSTTYGDGIFVKGDGTTNADFNTLTGNVCYDNGGDGIAIEGGGDANKNIVLGNQLTGNGGTALVDGGTATQIAHNITS